MYFRKFPPRSMRPFFRRKFA
uniref:Uncharacterized protein n=1 Tax=Romanomermis culicivorax TaxID=13658 RepID=A0A915JK86_ROMCU